MAIRSSRRGVTEQSSTRWARWQQRARDLNEQVLALYLAFRDRRTPWYARLWLALVVGYALSPIDLIPDFIPVVGYLDDLVLVPLGVAVAVRMLPVTVLAESRQRAADQFEAGRPTCWPAAVAVLVVWLAVAAWILVAVVRVVSRRG
jgi:uncharacterized membrane protein YkvA (DUF1232 family)